MPPTPEPLGRIFLDETIVWIRADERERPALRTCIGAETCCGRSSNTLLRARGNCRSEASSADPNRFAAKGLALFKSSDYLASAGNAVHVFRLTGRKTSASIGCSAVPSRPFDRASAAAIRIDGSCAALDVQVCQTDRTLAGGTAVSIASECAEAAPRSAPTCPVTNSTSPAISSKATSWAAASGSWR
jgi:hypothetical protein